jgi:hypothetical protein
MSEWVVVPCDLVAKGNIMCEIEVLRLRLLRMLSSRMLRRVVLVRIAVSEELFAIIIMLTRNWGARSNVSIFFRSVVRLLVTAISPILVNLMT